MSGSTKSITLKLEKIEDIKNLVNITKKYNFNIEIISNNYSVNAKSMIEIFSLDLTENLNLIAHTPDDCGLFDELKPYTI